MKIKEVRLVTLSRRCSKKSVPHMLPKYCEKYLIKRYCLVKWKWTLHSLAWYFSCYWQKCNYRKLVPNSSLLTNISVEHLLMFFSEEIIVIILIGENKNAKTLGRFKFFTSFMEFQPTIFFTNCFWKNRRPCAQKKICRLEIHDLKILKAPKRWWRQKLSTFSCTELFPFFHSETAFSRNKLPWKQITII